MMIYIMNHGPEAGGWGNEKSLYTEAGDSHNKSKHIIGQSSSHINICSSDESFKRVRWGLEIRPVLSHL